jgi:hypothetical protein
MPLNDSWENTLSDRLPRNHQHPVVKRLLTKYVMGHRKRLPESSDFPYCSTAQWGVHYHQLSRYNFLPGFFRQIAHFPPQMKTMCRALVDVIAWVSDGLQSYAHVDNLGIFGVIGGFLYSKLILVPDWFHCGWIVWFAFRCRDRMSF